MAHDPIEHVIDAEREWHMLGDWRLPLPAFNLFGHEFRLTKFMIIELMVALLLALIFIPLCRRAAKGMLPKGPFWNAFESLLTFIRDDVAKQNLGADADKYVPFLWTMFLFILFCNLLGFIPMLGTPTASIWVTGGLALISFVTLHVAAMLKLGRNHLEGGGHHGHGHDHGQAQHEAAAEMPHGHDHGHGHGHARPGSHGGFEIAAVGFVAYLKSLWPNIQIDIPVIGPIFSLVLNIGIWAIEFLGVFIKSGVLAIRLFANMFAGHMVSATILSFIAVAGEAALHDQIHVGLWGLITFASVLGIVALSMLELLVAFLQAYIFVFLTALFMGMAMNPEH